MRPVQKQEALAEESQNQKSILRQDRSLQGMYGEAGSSFARLVVAACRFFAKSACPVYIGGSKVLSYLTVYYVF